MVSNVRLSTGHINLISVTVVVFVSVIVAIIVSPDTVFVTVPLEQAVNTIIRIISSVNNENLLLMTLIDCSSLRYRGQYLAYGWGGLNLTA